MPLSPQTHSVDSQSVVEAILACFNATSHPGWQLSEPVQLKYMPWSTLYFLSITNQRQSEKIVAKIIRFPNQTNAQVSLENEELLLRGRREYASLSRVYQHFQSQDQAGLTSVKPITYLQEINAIVMAFVDAQPLYNTCLKPRQLLRNSGMPYAEILLKKSGQWLRWLHQLPLENPPEERIFTPIHTLQALQSDVQQLGQYGVHVEKLTGWDAALQCFQQYITPTQPVWCHCDFHLRNVFVLPEDRILSMDTALERVDMPYFDICKLTADIKTRKSRILLAGRIPNQQQVQQLTDAFLAGYFGGEVVDWTLYRLYEGHFILQKWHEILESIHESVHFVPTTGLRLAHKLTVDRVFKRIMRQWLDAVLALASD